MSCPNFETQENFKLFLWDFERPSDEELNKYILETDENKYTLEIDEDVTNVSDITESMRDKYAELMYEWDCRDIIDNFSETVNDILHTLKRELNFFEVTLKDGYYCGLQFYVEETGNMRYIDVEDVDNEDTRYYYDMCKSEFLRKYNSEINFINKKLMPKLAKFFSFEEYYCGGMFSNGEALYYKVENTNRAKLLRALKEVA